MERIYEVKIEHPYDHSIYFVRASSAPAAAQLGIQADAVTEAGKALRNDRAPHNQPRVSSVKEFCSTEQFVS